VLKKKFLLIQGMLLVSAASVVCLGSPLFAADEPRLLADYEDAMSADYAVVGIVVRTRNEDRQSDEYIIRDERDDIQYKLLSGAGVDRTSLVGRRVGLDGRTRLHEGLAEGVVYPQRVELLDRDVEPVNFLQSSPARSVPRAATNLPTDININIGDTMMPPHSVGTGMHGGQMPGYGLPGMGGFPGLGPECESCGRGGFLNGGGVWGRVDYLYWKTSGMELPPLVTTSPALTMQNDAGVIGAAGTTILYGGNEILDDHRHGGRIRAGVWLGPQFGLEAEYLRLANENSAFGASTDSTPILAVPFFNVNPRDPMNPALYAPSREDAYLISYPNVISGSVVATAENKFQSAGLRALLHMGGHSPGINCPEDRRIDLIFGYRTLQLEDQLLMRSQLTTLNGTNQMFDINDSFHTKNTFHGVETGAQVQGHWQRVSYEFLAKIAVGNTNQEVDINGNTDITVAGAGTTTNVGGLFAQSSNIGSASRDQFSVVPELNATLGFEFTKQLRATLGYNFIYWSRVVRAGDQIDREINQDLIPPAAMPVTGPQRPALAIRDTSFWAQGFNVGLDFRW